MLPAWMIQEEYEKVCGSNQELRDTIEELNKQLEDKDNRIAELEETLEEKQSQIDLQTQDHLALIERQKDLDAMVPRLMSSLKSIEDVLRQLDEYRADYNYIDAATIAQYSQVLHRLVNRGLYGLN